MAALDEARRAELIDRLAQSILRSGLRVPAIWLFEMHKPLAFLSAQALLFFQPVLGVFADEGAVHDYALLLEERENVERLLRRLEEGQAAVSEADSSGRDR